MTLQVSKWKVRDGSDLSEVGLAALAFCRAQRGRTQVDGARYYWAHPGEIWILVEGEEELVLTSIRPLRVMLRYTISMNSLCNQRAFYSLTRGLA